VKDLELVHDSAAEYLCFPEKNHIRFWNLRNLKGVPERDVEIKGKDIVITTLLPLEDDYLAAGCGEEDEKGNRSGTIYIYDWKIK
jgi:hypothetical protein